MKLTIEISDERAKRLRQKAFTAGCKSVTEYICQLIDEPGDTTIELLHGPVNTTIPTVRRVASTTIRKIPAYIGRRTEGD